MTTDQILAEIKEANLAFLLLSRQLLLADFAGATAQLGLTESSALKVRDMTMAQIRTIANTNTLMHRFDMLDEHVFGLLTSHGARSANQGSMVGPSLGSLARYAA